MKKNVLILSSSPRRGGNSDVLCDQFQLGAHDAGHRTEKIFLKDKTIHYCNGCGACINQKNPCVQQDDMAEILDKMIAADVIVLATPVYFYTMAAQMKTLIDRTAARYTDITGKDFYFIVAAADTNKEAMERTLEGFRGVTSCLTDPHEKGLILGVGAWNIGDIKKSGVMREAYEMGKQA